MIVGAEELCEGADHSPTVGTINDDGPLTLTVAGVNAGDGYPRAGGGDGELVFGGTLSAVAAGRSVSLFEVRSTSPQRVLTSKPPTNGGVPT